MYIGNIGVPFPAGLKDHRGQIAGDATNKDHMIALCALCYAGPGVYTSRLGACHGVFPYLKSQLRELAFIVVHRTKLKQTPPFWAARYLPLKMNNQHEGHKI